MSGEAVWNSQIMASNISEFAQQQIFRVNAFTDVSKFDIKSISNRHYAKTMPWVGVRALKNKEKCSTPSIGERLNLKLATHKTDESVPTLITSWEDMVDEYESLYDHV